MTNFESVESYVMREAGKDLFEYMTKDEIGAVYQYIEEAWKMTTNLIEEIIISFGNVADVDKALNLLHADDHDGLFRLLAGIATKLGKEEWPVINQILDGKRLTIINKVDSAKRIITAVALRAKFKVTGSVNGNSDGIHELGSNAWRINKFCYEVLSSLYFIIDHIPGQPAPRYTLES
jgi:hypothetical protein